MKAVIRKIDEELPVCPHCNHRHRSTKESNYKMDKCPYCNCPLHYSLIIEEYIF